MAVRVSDLDRINCERKGTAISGKLGGVDGRVTTQRRYYLSSLPAQVQRFAAAVRGHWQIENCLHWVLDVQLGEDRCAARQQNAAQNLAALRALCLPTAPQPASPTRRPQQTKAAGWDHHYLASLLTF
jgi:predicted transposase YbfD/YdcC